MVQKYGRTSQLELLVTKTLSFCNIKLPRKEKGKRKTKRNIKICIIFPPDSRVLHIISTYLWFLRWKQRVFEISTCFKYVKRREGLQVVPENPDLNPSVTIEL